LLERARKVLGLGPRFSDPELRAAFRREVKTAHPDQKGDPARFRLVMSAYRFLRTELDSVR
jgi:curved DNA-binding protein CbpA